MCWCLQFRISLSTCLVGVAIMALMVAQSSAQTPDARVVAAVGPEQGDPNLPEPPVWETDIAAGADRIISVFIGGARYPYYGHMHGQTGYRIADLDPNGNWVWGAEGVIPDVPHAFDPSIAYNSITGDFVVVSLSHGPLGVAHSTPSDPNDGPFADGWSSIDPNSALPGTDKCWLIAGEMTQEVQEFYAISHTQDGDPYSLVYFRSTDGGYDWHGDYIRVDGDIATGRNGSYPAVVDDGPVYVLDVLLDDPNADGGYIIFLQGEDDGSGVTWDYLAASPWWPKPVIELHFEQWLLNDYIPYDLVDGINTSMRAHPRIAADPSDPNALHVVYADLVDTSDPNDGDVDVFYVKLTRHYFLGEPYWTASNPLRVNDDDAEDHISDQFLPTIVVDSQGVIHVVFYDDRDFPDQDENTASSVQFNVYYAYSTTGGATWAPNQVLYLDPQADPADDACLDLLEDEADDLMFHLGEYIGIAVREMGNGEREVWTSYTGTMDENDPNDLEESIILATRIPWSDE